MRKTRPTKTFFVTVGQRFRNKPHPLGAHPDGWIEVTASGELEARDAITKACQMNWGFIYTEEEFKVDRHLYKRGCVARVTGF